MGDAAQDGGYLGSAHVLALVPVCVAHSVDEIDETVRIRLIDQAINAIRRNQTQSDETVRIRLQQVAGAEPAVATLYKVEAIKANQGRSHLQQVAGAEPAVATLEHIEDELAPCRLAIRVAGEVARRIALVHLQACTQLPSTAALGAIVSEPWQSTALRAPS